MSRKTRASLGACLLTLAAAAIVFVQMPPMLASAKSTAFYTQTNLVTSMRSLRAKFHDKNLVNPWGLVQGPTPFWISDNNAGVSTLYDGKGKIFTVAVGKKKVPFVVTIPPPGGSTAMAAPSGIVFNGTTADFGGDLFIFSTEDGTMSGWQVTDGTG